MNWADELCNLYDKHSDHVGKMEYKEYTTAKGTQRIPYVLLPPFHTTVTAQVTVTIDGDGKFLGAEIVDQSDKLTIIPVTEKSGSRTSHAEPHPLCDNLKYVAGDYFNYYEAAPVQDKVCYPSYIQALEKWHTSLCSHSKVDAIYYYLNKKCLIHDLVEQKILILDEGGQLSDKVKIQGIEQTKILIRFRVRQKIADFESILSDTSGRYCEECWKDRTLMDSFVSYYRTLEDQIGLCYLSGNFEQISYLHSKKIRNEGDGSKLISANDKDNYTFRGRFATKEEAFAIGNETSQKIHSALKWIIRKQGRTYDTMCLVTWESDALPMPKWDAGTDEIVGGFNSEKESDPWGDAGASLEPLDADTNNIGAEKFYSAMEGYGKNLKGLSRMVLMAFDAATPGRLSLIEFKVLESARYLDNIKYWHTECQWLHTRKTKGKTRSFMGMVGVREIAEILYGTESNGILTIPDQNRKRMYAEICKRMLSCIWDRRPIPIDLVNLAVNRASAPLAFKERYNWERVLALACSLVKKNKHERNPEEVWTLAVDEKCKERDYLYGRLLAIADRVEYRTFEKDKDNYRVTNAKRYMNAFSQRPFETWKVIEESIQPYFEKLKLGERLRYQNLIDEICNDFKTDNFTNNTHLDGLYLLGFHCQAYELKHFKDEEDKENE